MIIDEEDYLEHFGVKGMKWGVHRDGTRRTTGQKFASVGVGAAAGLVTANLVTAKTLNVPLALVLGSGAAFAGSRFMRSRQNKHRKVKLSSLSGSK